MIELNNISKIYNSKKANECRALDGISLTINKGELIAIMGKSGSGKTTLLNLIGGIDKPTEGDILFEGVKMTDYNEKELANYRNQKVGSVFQDFLLVNELSSLTNVLLPMYLSKTKNQDRVKKATQLIHGVGLGAKIDEKTINLSGGEKQRVAIARALANDPEIILADEPTGALDTVNSKEIIDMLIRINARGNTIIIVTHEMDIAAQCKRIITISDGKILEDKTS